MQAIHLVAFHPTFVTFILRSLFGLYILTPFFMHLLHCSIYGGKGFFFSNYENNYDLHDVMVYSFHAYDCVFVHIIVHVHEM